MISAEKVRRRMVKYIFGVSLLHRLQIKRRPPRVLDCAASRDLPESGSRRERRARTVESHLSSGGGRMPQTAGYVGIASVLAVFGRLCNHVFDPAAVARSCRARFPHRPQFQHPERRLCLPILRCATSGDLRDRANTNSAEPINKGLVRCSRKSPAVRSTNFHPRNLAQRGKAFKLDAWKHSLQGVYGQIAVAEGLYNLFAFFLHRCLSGPG